MHFNTKILKKILLSVIVLAVLFFAFIWFSQGWQLKDIDSDNPPRFARADFIDLDNVVEISKFRSGAGHDNSGNGETCRSMKHYFLSEGESFSNEMILVPPPSESEAQNIYSPVDGRVASISVSEKPINDYQINIAVDDFPGYQIRLEHVYPADGVRNFTKVKAGQKIAKKWPGRTVDISVYYNYIFQTKLISYFKVLPDHLFEKYKKNSIQSRDDFIITKEYRDAHPLQCLSNRRLTPDFAEDYTSTPEGREENMVVMSEGGRYGKLPPLPKNICPDNYDLSSMTGVYKDEKYRILPEDKDFIGKCPLEQKEE